MSDQVLAGRYRLGHIIGQGGMAVVYQAEDAVLGRDVALKMLREQFTADPEFVQRFEREARAAARLSHPGIVQIYDVGIDNGAHFIVMELVAGEDLKSRVRRFGALPPAEVIRLGREIAGALDFAHRKGLVHRDVKPQNVLLDESGHVRLTDFGIAQAVDSASITQTGIVLGTAQYMAPEQARGLKTGPASDVYSLGVLLFELATGRLPFPGDNALAVALRHVEEEPIPPSQLNPSVPDALDSVILRALAKDPTQRFASAAELSQALANIPDPVRQQTARLPTVASTGVRLDQAAAPVSRTTRRPAVASTDTRREQAAAPVSRTTRRPTVAARPPAPAVRPAPRKGGGSGWIVLLLGLSLALVALGAFWIFGANRFRLPTAAPTPTATAPIIVAPTTAPTATVRPEPTTAPRTPTPPPTATAAPTQAATATRVPPTASPAPTSPPQTTVAVPNLVGLDLGAAERALSQRGLVLTFRDGNDPRKAEGVILEQTPRDGEQVAQRSTVSLIVNRLATVVVPNAQGLEEAEARRVVEKEGLKAVFERGNGGRKGVVYNQSPQPGFKAAPGSEVRLSIGS